MNAKNLKPFLLAVLRPATGALIRAGVHPNLLTVVGVLVSVLAGAVYAVGSLALGAVLLLVSGLFDVLDGAVAREGRRLSRFGAFFDSCLDRWAEIAVFAGILWRLREDGVALVVGVLALGGSLMVSYTKARAEGLGLEVGGGMLQRPERLIGLALGSFFGEPGLRLVLWVLAILGNLTAVQRMVRVARDLRDRSPDEDGDEPSASRTGEIETAPPSR